MHSRARWGLAGPGQSGLGQDVPVAGNRGVPVITAQVAQGTAVIEPDPHRPGGYLLLVGGAQQSYVDLADPTHLEFEYVRWIGHILDCRPIGPVRALHLGGGGLTLPRYVLATRSRSRNIVVEFDAPLVELVRTHLPWQSGIRVRIGDGRTNVNAARPGSTDVIISDIFADARNPGNVTTMEFFARAREVLAPGGTFVANLADRSPFPYARRFLAGMLASFPQVIVMADAAVWRGRRFGNFVAAADAGSPDPQGETGLPSPDELARRTRRDPWPARVVQGPELRTFCSGAKPFEDVDAPGSPTPPPGIFSP
jgi:hypothetical protein